MITPHERPHDTLASSVLARIKGEGLAPRTRLSFILENYVFWGIGALAVLLGALAFSAGLFEVENAGWDLYPATHNTLASFFLESAPFLWLVVLIAFVILGYLNIRRTNRGYRYPLAAIALGAILASVPLGSALYALGVGGAVESALGDHPPFYRPILLKERSWWAAPEAGLLGGTVESSTPDLATFTLNDFDNTQWTVDTADLARRDKVVVAHGGAVRVVGVVSTSSPEAFHACFVFPWRATGTRATHLVAPVALLSSSTAINAHGVRSEVCKGIRPYDKLRVIDDDLSSPLD